VGGLLSNYFIYVQLVSSTAHARYDKMQCGMHGHQLISHSGVVLALKLCFVAPVYLNVVTVDRALPQAFQSTLLSL
jgi:hypothetical protein